jgi:hypothetical protein
MVARQRPVVCHDLSMRVSNPDRGREPSTPPDTHFERPELTQDLINLGSRVAGVVIGWQDWAHRKVESLDLLPRERGRRRVSVDCTPIHLQFGDVRPPENVGANATLVPLTLMAKLPLQGLDVTDASGHTVPVLGSASNGLIAAATIAFIVWAVENQDLARVRESWPRIFDIAVKSREIAGHEARSLIGELQLNGALARVVQDLAECFLLVVVLPVESAGVRQVLKYSYHWETGGSGRWLRRGIDVLTAGFGLRRFTLSVEVGATSTARSYHLECLAPDGLASAGLDLPADVSGIRQTATKSSQVSHAFGHYPAFRTPRVQTAVVKFNLEFPGLIARVFWASAATTAIFLVMSFRPRAYLALSNSVDAATALFLFVPALLVALNVRGRENVTVGRLLLPLRTVSILLSLLLFVAGALLVLGAPKDVTVDAWWISTGFAAFSTVLTAAGLIRLRIMSRG